MELHDLIENLLEMKRIDSPVLSSISDFDFLISSLRELENMVEMEELKSSVVSQIKFLLINGYKLDGHMLHTVIYSKPGTGKTTVSVILAKIWTAIGLFKKYNVKKQSTPNTKPPQQKLLKNEEKKELELQIQRLNSSGKLKTGVIERLQTQISLVKTNINDFKTLLDSNNYNLRRLLRNLKGNNFDDRLSRNLIDTCIQNNNKLFFNIDMEVKTTTPDEQIRFITPVQLPSPHIIEYKPIKPSIEDIPVKYKKLPPELDKNFEQIKIVSREDFVGGYLGQTALKTESLLKSNLGKVLFIDEAYSLIHDEKDSYGMEALTVLNRYMSEHSDDLVIIFAGYKDLLENTIFKFQPGLKRRCSWYFEIKDYSEKGLAKIFMKQVHDSGWIPDKEDLLIEFFKEHKKEFPFCGGDTLRLAFYCKICYSEDVFDRNLENTKYISVDIMNRALLYLKEYRIKENNGESLPHPNMYF